MNRVTRLTFEIEPPAAAPSTRTTDGTPLVFGRGTDADVVCPDHSMSRRHARIAADASGWHIEDLGARNGTFLNGGRITGRTPLAPGDVVRMGATIVRVVDRTPAAAGGRAVVLGDDQLGTSILRPVVDLLAGDDVRDARGTDVIRTAARLKALVEFHRAIGQALSLDALLELLFDQLFAALHPEEGVILLRRPDGTLHTAASRRLPGATGDLLVSQRLIREVVDKATAALVNDIEFDDRFATAQSMVSSGVRGILAAPFTDADGCVGMVAVYSRTRIRRFGEEDLELLVSLASAAALRIRNVALADAAAARRVEDHELALAHDIQMGMLPRAMPTEAGITMAARLIPARAVGGDLYDFFVRGDRLWFIVADAAGKGVSAALFMAVTRTLFRAVIHDDSSVAEVAGRINAELARDNERQVFVTALVGRLALQTGELACCNAGHPPILHASPDGTIRPLADNCHGIAFGVLEDVEYREAQATLRPGDVLLLFTDGVTESVNSDGALFSDDRLVEVLRAHVSRPVVEVVDGVVNAVQAFAAGAPQEDDITVLAVARGMGKG
jgi:phosphoserine phosphatase RsbU/P